MIERSPRHRDVEDRAPGTGHGPASDVARDRLGAHLSSEVAATRAAWTDALLRSDAALRDGDADRARRALDDQRVLLTQLQRRLDRAVTSALVEREAEQVLRGSGLDAADAGTSHPPTLPADPVGDHDEAAVRRSWRRSRALTGAAAAVVVGLVALVVGSAPPPTPQITAMDAPAPVVDAEPEQVGPGWTLVASAPAPADELRHLAPVVPVPAEPSPAEAHAPSEPEAEDDTEVADEPADAGADAGRATPDRAPYQVPTDEPEPDGDLGEEREGEELEEEADGDGLTDRLPGVDQPISERLGQRIEGLLEP